MDGPRNQKFWGYAALFCIQTMYFGAAFTYFSIKYQEKVKQWQLTIEFVRIMDRKLVFNVFWLLDNIAKAPFTRDFLTISSNYYYNNLLDNDKYSQNGVLSEVFSLKIFVEFETEFLENTIFFEKYYIF